MRPPVALAEARLLCELRFAVRSTSSVGALYERIGEASVRTSALAEVKLLLCASAGRAQGWPHCARPFQHGQLRPAIGHGGNQDWVWEAGIAPEDETGLPLIRHPL